MDLFECLLERKILESINPNQFCYADIVYLPIVMPAYFMKTYTTA